MEKHIRMAREEDADRITDLCVISSPRHIRTSKYWIWSNLESPFGESLSLVVEADRKIISHYSILPTIFKVNGNSELLGFGQQAVVHPDHRDLKTIVELTDVLWTKASSRFKFIYGFPNDNFWKVKKALMGWREVCEFRAYVLNVEALGQIKIDSDLTIKRINKFPRSMDNWVNNNKTEMFFPMKSADFLNWRVFEHPLNHYIVFGAYDKQQLTGYMILKLYLNEQKQLIGHFIDWDVKDNDMKIFKGLLQKAREFFLFARIEKIVFWYFGDAYKDYIKELKVQPVGFKTNWGIKFLSDTGIEEALDYGNWYMTMLFSDAF